ncbi:MAG: 2'-5' RNA ligase family protein [Chloroflexota bacterium]|nr:MAG: 2'-5' RNA ligase family protein [Chloroflexota bacterium]
MAASALVVPLRLPPRLAAIRRREVAVARLGVPAHVTILSPFVDSARLDRRVVARIGEIVARVPAFDVELAAVRRWPASDLGPGVVWLEPRPGQPFVALTRAIWAAFPDHPPYGREDDELEAHLTLAIDDPARFDAVEAEAWRLVPFHRRVTIVALLVEDLDGRWRTRRRFPLGG